MSPQENNRIAAWIGLVLLLGAILAAVAGLAMLIGSSGIILKKNLFAILQQKGTAEYTILFQIRLPRVLLGIAVGGILSVTGVMLQGIFRNPLVEPYTLGISGGAALGVALGMILRRSAILLAVSIPFWGFLGAILVIISIYLLSVNRREVQMQSVLLTGVMISFICSALIMLVMAVSRLRDLHGIILWVMGSLDETSWTLVIPVFLVSLTGLLLSYLFAIDLNAIALGEEEAAHLGVRVDRTKRNIFILSSLVTGIAVSVAGIIGFVGLVVPHFMRMVIGRDHRILLVTSYLGGAIFIIVCDTLARTIISPLELPVGVITGIIGGTVFLFSLSKWRVRL